MNGRTRSRLVVLHVLVAALLLVLAGRMWVLMVVNGEHYSVVAAENRTRDIVVPAVRGSILDVDGRPLVRNRTALVVSVDLTVLGRLPDKGKQVIAELAKVLGTTPEDLALRTRLCSPTVPRPCWPGSPYQPIPVDDRVSAKQGLQILERQEEFPGVIAQVQAVREHPEPEGASAAQALGYLQPITQEEMDRRQGLRVTGFSGVDLIGRDGLEASYDTDLRGEPGIRKVNVDARGRVTGIAGEQAPVPGSHLVTSIDAGVQAAVEKAIGVQVANVRKAGGKPSAAGVVMDVRTGRIVALASYPTYDPAIWTGGISQDEYDALLGKKRGEPLISRAIAGQFPPASTFKISSVAAAVRNGSPLKGTYNCPGSFMVGDRAFRNFEGQGHGPMSLHTALVVSCDTIFYKFAYDAWLRDGSTKPVKNPRDPMIGMARDFGFGAKTGIDLPGEAPGRIPDRTWKKNFWEATKTENCKRAKTGYPEVTSPTRASYLTAIAKENCVEGFVWRAGDAANFSVGQGDVLVTPLQLARAYAAIANGGTLVTPHVGAAVVRPDGTVVRRIEPKPAGKIPVAPKTITYIRDALADVTKSGTAAGAFGGFPLDKVHVAGKTGTAEVYGYKDTAWFASFAPAKKADYAVVVMITDAGTGGTYSAPAVRQIYEAIYGFGDTAKAALPDGKLPTTLPKVTP
ncbi:penicillin-binding protein 2 [Actinocorallia sp. API 0066]|uniref:penicillin-binding protein 2 n=1 Tax=Actinocorallia sp. API 0066 TaxID=2896846 RepID=UPI001E3FB0A1|nr:penicillin-binding protein 2 [Actinocorallia sp. API 0066]MCD0452867.1 penicillin-binding protein 2 [Actinocorallia sp. API 0066]